MYYLITKWFGTFLYKNTTLQNHILFPKTEKAIAQRIQKIQQNKILTEEKQLTKNTTQLTVNEKRLQKLGKLKPDDPLFTQLTPNPNNYNFSPDLIHKAQLIITKKSVHEALQSNDLQIIQMVNAYDDLIQISNTLSERLTAWSLIPTPHEKKTPYTNVEKTVHQQMKQLEELIIKDMKQIAPNMSIISSPMIAARLVSIAGGLNRLALMPASTIQILGAEKALFRFKKTGKKPPKHGIIFQHQIINQAPPSERGKIARALATKITTAVKADVFTKRDISKQLLQDLNIRLKEIKNK